MGVYLGWNLRISGFERYIYLMFLSREIDIKLCQNNRGSLEHFSIFKKFKCLDKDIYFVYLFTYITVTLFRYFFIQLVYSLFFIRFSKKIFKNKRCSSEDVNFNFEFLHTRYITLRDTLRIIEIWKRWIFEIYLRYIWDKRNKSTNQVGLGRLDNIQTQIMSWEEVLI